MHLCSSTYMKTIVRDSFYASAEDLINQLSKKRKLSTHMCKAFATTLLNVDPDDKRILFPQSTDKLHLLFLAGFRCASSLTFELKDREQIMGRECPKELVTEKISNTVFQKIAYEVLTQDFYNISQQSEIDVLKIVSEVVDEMPLSHYKKIIHPLVDGRRVCNKTLMFQRGFATRFHFVNIE